MAMEYLFAAPNGKEYHFRLRAREQQKLCEQIGMGINEALVEIIKGNYVKFMANLIHLSAQQFQHGFKLDDAYDLIDELAENGYDFTKFSDLATDILEASGFFANGSASEMRRTTAEIRKALDEQSN